MNAAVMLQFSLALLFVLALIGGAAVLVRRFSPGGLVRWRPGQERRLGVVEVLALDPRRRLVLIRRDTVEHLLLLGVGEDRVVETGIVRAGFRTAMDRAEAVGAPPPSPSPKLSPEPPPELAPDPLPGSSPGPSKEPS